MALRSGAIGTAVSLAPRSSAARRCRPRRSPSSSPPVGTRLTAPSPSVQTLAQNSSRSSAHARSLGASTNDRRPDSSLSGAGLLGRAPSAVGVQERVVARDDDHPRLGDVDEVGPPRRPAPSSPSGTGRGCTPAIVGVDGSAAMASASASGTPNATQRRPTAPRASPRAAAPRTPRPRRASARSWRSRATRSSTSARPAASVTQERTRSGRRLTTRTVKPPPQSWPTRSTGLVRWLRARR